MSPNLKRGFYQYSEIIIMDYLSDSYPIGAIFTSADDAEKGRREGGEGGKIDALGIYTKFQSNRSTSDFQDNRLLRLTRYCLQDLSAKLLPKERVNFCLRRRISKDTGVKVMFNPVREKAHYSNVVRCGSVWTCPICSAQVAEKRRLELKKGMENWKNKHGGEVYLLTLTNPHYQGDNLKQLLEGQKKALAYLWGDRAPKEMFKNLGKAGHVIAAEVTYGENGFHPHYHILLFMRHSITIDAFRSFLAYQWQNCCKKAGLPIPSIEHGVDLQNGTFALDYVSKWGLEDEMTKAHIKRSNKGFSMFDLVRAYQETGDEKYKRVFMVFYRAFKRQQQLVWSKGLKDKLLIEDKTDEELNAEETEQAVEFKEFTREEWKAVRVSNSMAYMLDLAEQSPDKFDKVLKGLVRLYGD